MTLRSCAVVVSFLWLAAVSNAATFVVDATTDDVDAAPGNGVCATAGGACTLRAAVQEAEVLPGPDTITLPAGIYHLTIPHGPFEELDGSKGDLEVASDLTVNGAGSGVTVIDANDIDRVFDAFEATLTVNDLTIRNGNALFGGGIANAAGTLTLNDVVVTDCQTFPMGLAGAISNSGVLVMTGGALTNNRAGEGGAIFMNDGSARLVNVTISGNHATRDAGGIKYHAPATSMSITGCTISDNQADARAGGLVFSEATLTMVNSTVSGNRAVQGVGGILAYGPGTLSNVTITDNEADSGGLFSGTTGGILLLAPQSAGLVVRNSIIAGNHAASFADCEGTLTSGGHNVIGDCAITGDTTGNVVGALPGLAPLANNGGPTPTHLPLPGSPASSAGNPAVPGSGGNACEATDQRGVARPQGARCDIGAVEGAPACGDGSVDPGETCDDRNLLDGDCCTAACQAEPGGGPCTDDGAVCTLDLCDAAGSCGHPAGPSGVPCPDDGAECTVDTCDGAGSCGQPVAAGTACTADALACTADACDGAGACAHPPAIDAGCAAAVPGGSRVTVRSRRSKISWQWRGADAVAKSDFGTPTASTEYRVCVIDDVGGTPRLVAEVPLPSGKRWTEQATGFRYRNRGGTTVARLRAGGITYVGTTPSLPLEPLPLATPVVVRLQRADAAACWESRFAAASKSNARVFKAQGD